MCSIGGLAVARYQLDHTEIKQNFGYFLPIQSRWNDLDPYRHINNARYHAYFDTVIMHYLVCDGGFDLLDGPVLPFTVENLCRFHAPIGFPAIVDCGLRVGRLGRTSVRYEIGLFTDASPKVAATGYFIDVFVDRATQRPVPLPEPIRSHLAKILLQRA